MFPKQKQSNGAIVFGLMLFMVVLTEAHREHKVHNIVLYPDKHSWCRTTTIKQVISYPGCKSEEIDNNVCVGACFSYSIPHTEPSDPGEVSVYSVMRWGMNVYMNDTKTARVATKMPVLKKKRSIRQQRFYVGHRYHLIRCKIDNWWIHSGITYEPLVRRAQPQLWNSAQRVTKVTNTYSYQELICQAIVVTGYWLMQFQTWFLVQNIHLVQDFLIIWSDNILSPGF